MKPHETDYIVLVRGFEGSNAQLPILRTAPILGPVDRHLARRQRGSKPGSNARPDRREYQDENAGFPFLVIGRARHSADRESTRRTDHKSKQCIPATVGAFPILHAEDVGARNRDFTLLRAQRDRFLGIPGEGPLP